MPAMDASGPLSGSASHLLRVLIGVLVFVGALVTCRWGIRTFVLNRGQTSQRWRTLHAAGEGVVLVLLLLLQDPAEKLLTALGGALSGWRPQLGWLGATLVGIYSVLIATAILLLAVHAVGWVYASADRRIEAWQHRLRARGPSGESDPRFHTSRILRLGIRVLRNALIVVVLLGYFGYGFSVFPRTRVFTGTLREILGPPFADAVQAIDNYIPNLGYLFVILACGWVLLKAMKYLFAAIQNGTIVIERFPVDWANPTYKLCRSILFLFVLMVSFPYLPGANSAFFRGFSLFVGALVTFGSSGAIGNLLAGILLTYTRAFRMGDVVLIDGVSGKVTEKTLLATRVVTMRNEQVTIPNSKVLTVAVTNYSAHDLGKGIAMGVAATIGYDVDWRTVHQLLLEGARRTEQIVSEPAPQVFESSFGNYSVEYELRAWTKTSERVFETRAALRRNILDAFADAGVEIMTPTILSHRDASELAVPHERFPHRLRARGIRVTVDPPNQASE